MKKNSYWYSFLHPQGIKKLLLTMKITILLCLLTVLNVNASLYSQSTALDLSVNQKSVREVLKTIEKQSNFRFFYNEEFSDLNKTVSLDLKGKKLDEVLTMLLENSGVTYKILENDVVVITPAGEMSQQQKITGKIVDATTGEPLPGVNVVIQGSTAGTTTDIDGKYAISVDNADAVLLFSFIGYISQSVSVSGKSVIDVSLAPDVQKLDEIVVIGYGMQRKEAVTGSVASITGEVVREVPTANVTQALQGRIAGVQMAQTSSKPGATMQIRIRGTRSLTASNDPLVVLDGIPFAGSLGDIDPSIVKSYDVLKDASATAIYGSRGANGVILITTNKGQKGQNARFTYNGYYGVRSIFAQYPMMNAQEFIQLRKDVPATISYWSKPGGSEDTTGLTNTNWQDLLYQKGAVTSQDFNVTNGSEKGNYMFGANYFRDESVLPGQNYTRYLVRASVDQEINKYLRLGFTTNNSYSITELGNYTPFYSVLSNSPIASPYDATGTLRRVIDMPLDHNWNATKTTIEGLGDKWIDESKAFASYNSMYGEVKIPGVEGLKYRTNIGLNYRQVSSGNYTGQGVFSDNPLNVSNAGISNSMMYNWTIENMLTFDRSIGKHQINAVALYSAEQTFNNGSRVTGQDLANDQFQYYNIGTAAQNITVDPANQSYTLSGLMSWMGRAMYSFDGRYMISLTYRSDGSSRLAPGHKWHSYPAISVGWNISNESFMKDLGMIDLLKVRFGFGQTSNQSVNPYSTMGGLGTRPYNFGPTTYSYGYFVNQLASYNLGWEYSKTTNIGLDFGLFKNRLTGTVEYYETKTSDLLLNQGLPPTDGVNTITANVGATQNKGIEISLAGMILNNLNGWTWEAGINFSANRNKIVSLSSGSLEDKNNNWFVGQPIDCIYDYQKIGIWQNDKDTVSLKILEPGTNLKDRIGMIKVKYTGPVDSITGLPTRQINPDDRQVMSMEPKFEGGFNTRVSYKGFDLNIVGIYKNGGILISSLYSGGGYLNMESGRRNNVKIDYWTPTNTGAKYPAPGVNMSGDNPKYASTLGYFDASYLKIRAITLGYSINKNMLGKTGIEKLRVYFTVENPFVFFSPYKKESGMDPETNSYGNENAAVALPSNLRRLLTTGTNTPSTVNYMVGLSLTF
jgi:TonB-linked SusC/RagA family outer membrane protein